MDLVLPITSTEQRRVWCSWGCGRLVQTQFINQDPGDSWQKNYRVCAKWMEGGKSCESVFESRDV